MKHRFVPSMTVFYYYSYGFPGISGGGYGDLRGGGTGSVFEVHSGDGWGPEEDYLPGAGYHDRGRRTCNWYPTVKDDS